MTPGNKKTLTLPILLVLVSMVFFAIAPRQATGSLAPDTSDYTPLAPIEGTYDTATGKTNLATYLTGIFKVGVAGAGVLAFLMIVWGGFTYLSTDVITGKEEGKARIERAVGGLILALTSYIILNTINPSLVSLDLYFGAPADQSKMNRLAAPADAATDLTLNHEETDRQLEKLKTDSVTRDTDMTKTVADKKEEARKLKEIADTLPAGAEKTALLKKVAGLNREAGETDLQRVAEGEERQASLNTLNAYTPEKLAAAITEAGSSIQKIQEAYAKARTEFASDPARVAALSSEEMTKIAVIRKSTAFGIIENPPHDPNSAMVVDERALITQVGEQMSLIKTEERNQIAALTNLNGQNTGLKSSDISIRMAEIHNTANQQICQIKNLCKVNGGAAKGYGCDTLYPSVQCVY